MTALKIISKREYEMKNEKPEQEQVWDSIAKPWNKYVVKKIPIVEEFLENKKGKVVDLGCGDGRNMISGSFEYWGVDFSGESLKHVEKRAKKEGLKVKVFKSKVDELPSEFREEMFDCGLFIATLHCLESKGERKNALKEFYRVLKPDAEALISVWNSGDKRFDSVDNQGDIYMSWLEGGKPYMRHYYLYGKSEFLNLLKSVGFEVLHFYFPREHDRFSKKNWIVKVGK